MDTYKAEVKVTVTKTIITSVYIEAVDAKKAKQQLELMYGKTNVLGNVQLVRGK